jgi:hypothetical protein
VIYAISDLHFYLSYKTPVILRSEHFARLHALCVKQMDWLSYLPFIQPTEKELKENITTGNERFAQVSIHGVGENLLVSVLGDGFDEFATLFHFFLPMISAKSRNHHFQDPTIDFIIRMRYPGVGKLACAKEETSDLGYLNSNVGNDRA